MKFSGSDVAAASCSSGYDVVAAASCSSGYDVVAAASCSSGSAASSSSGSDDTATVSSSSETEDYFCTASIFQSTDVIPMPIDSSDDNEHIGKGAGEFFDGALDDVSSLSASEECYQESSDANFSNITFSLPGNDFMIYFPGNPNLLNKITQVTIANGIKEIPLIIVNEYEHKGYESNITLIISGIDLYSKETMVYSVNPKNKNIRLSFVNRSIELNIPNVGTYGAEYGGMWSITNAIMKSEFKIDWDRLTIEGAIDLGKACLKATATAAKYGIIQGVSETYDVYIVSLFSGTGWIIDDKLKPDENATNDARKKYMMEQAEKDYKKQKRLKRNAEKKAKGQT